MLIENNGKFIVHALMITGEKILAIISISEPEVFNIQPSNTAIQIRNNNNQVAKLIAATDLGKIENVKFLVAEFEPRPENSIELYLQFTNAATVAVTKEVEIANLLDPPETTASRIYLSGNNKTYQQDNLKITFLGWVAPPVAIPTDKELNPDQSEIENKASLQVEMNETKNTNYIYIMLLQNGNIKSLILG